MDGETTSRGGLCRFMPKVWVEWARFVSRPILPVSRRQFGARTMGEVGQLLALTIAFDMVLVVGLSWLATRMGIKTPEFEELRRYGPVVTMLVGALGLPMLEELVFRGWLTGQPWMLAVVGGVIGAVLTLLAMRTFVGPLHYSEAAIVLLVWTAAGAAILFHAKNEPPEWFGSAFPALYFASALLFGLAHISNYDLARPLLLLPFVVPQTIAGLIFGFARVRYGMWANIALHATSNALFLGLSLAGN